MARIELRYADIYLQDGLSGTGAVNSAVAAIGDVSLPIDTVVLNTAPTTLVPVGARFTIAGDPQTDGLCDVVYTVTAQTDGTPGTTDTITFTPALDFAPADDAVITFLPQRLAIKIGEGNLTYSETKNMIYDLDRGQLDTVREGDDAPVQVSLAATYEFVASSSGEPITPIEALKGQGNAATWVSSSADPCEPRAVDVIVVYTPQCSTGGVAVQKEQTVLKDFRYESLDVDLEAASISMSGQCNVTEAIVSRVDCDV